MRFRTRLLLDTLAVATVMLGAAVAAALVLYATGTRFPAAALAMILGAGFAAGAVAAWLVTAVRSRRIHLLAQLAERQRRQDFSERLRISGNDELAGAVSALADGIQSLRDRIGELTRDRVRMEAILAGMVEGVLVVDEQGVVRLANEAARRLLHFHGDPVGRRYVELIRHPDIEAQIRRCLRGDAADAQELTLAADPVRTVIARATRVSAGSATGVVLVLHDITDLRHADRVRRDFVANVSHELRTPLTAIRGYVEALLDSTPDAAESRRFLEIIARHSSRMERLVRDLLRLTRLDAGQEPLERVRFGVDALFGGVLNELEPLLAGRAQRAVVEVAPDATSIEGDPAKLHDALRNLVENASNYAPEGTTVTLTASRRGDRLVIEVADEGAGIPEADLHRVFERFYRVDKARSRDTGGTGLGLSIVKHLIGLHGGDVRARNRPEGGAVFTVTLPG
ncbi:MAG TPA: ATP-binding protein [Vicinamibacterales bacterium]